MSTTDWSYFRENLLGWYRPEQRPMPWKAVKNPYHIWLSEIILQQTRVAQGLPYFERFVATFPTVMDLAAAEDDAVMKLWEGLGYYSRARNLLKTARVVANEHGGKFPDTLTGLLTLPGVGPYTAAAIASFAFDRQVAVLDGNVYRILARFTGDTTPIDASRSRKYYDGVAEAALASAPAARFNQAIMDFGALVCTPRNAGCASCPLAEGCAALAAGTVYDLPVKEKKLKRRERYFHYLIVEDESGHTIIEQRQAKDIWRELYQFPLVEAMRKDLEFTGLASEAGWPEWLPAGELDYVKTGRPLKHQLTHQTIITTFHHFRWKKMPLSTEGKLIIKNKKLRKFAFPRVITRYLSEESLTLDLFNQQ